MTAQDIDPLAPSGPGADPIVSDPAHLTVFIDDGSDAGASARAAERRAKLAAEAPARAEKTIAVLRSCPPRPREVVVAGVAETRRGKRVAATT